MLPEQETADVIKSRECTDDEDDTPSSIPLKIIVVTICMTELLAFSVEY